MHRDERKTDEVTYPPDDCGFCPRHKGVRVDLHLLKVQPSRTYSALMYLFESYNMLCFSVKHLLKNVFLNKTGTLQPITNVGCELQRRLCSGYKCFG